MTKKYCKNCKYYLLIEYYLSDYRPHTLFIEYCKLHNNDLQNLPFIKPCGYYKRKWYKFWVK